MKANHAKTHLYNKSNCILARALILAGLSLVLLANFSQAFTLAPGGTNNPSYTPLNSWSFTDFTNWTSDAGYYPVSFTNLTTSALGDGSALVVNSTNPAWLQYNVVETNGATNLTVDVGSVTFWYAPAWASTNQGGSGPGEWGRLLEVGGYTPDSSFGLWSLYVDEVGANIYFSAQTNDFSSNFCTYAPPPSLGTPIIGISLRSPIPAPIPPCIWTASWPPTGRPSPIIRGRSPWPTVSLWAATATGFIKRRA